MTGTIRCILSENTMLVLLVILGLLRCWLLSEADKVDKVAVSILLDLIAGSALVVPAVAWVSAFSMIRMSNCNTSSTRRNNRREPIKPPPIDPSLRIDAPRSFAWARGGGGRMLVRLRGWADTLCDLLRVGRG